MTNEEESLGDQILVGSCILGGYMVVLDQRTGGKFLWEGLYSPQISDMRAHWAVCLLAVTLLNVFGVF